MWIMLDGILMVAETHGSCLKNGMRFVRWGWSGPMSSSHWVDNLPVASRLPVCRCSSAELRVGYHEFQHRFSELDVGVEHFVLFVMSEIGNHVDFIVLICFRSCVSELYNHI